MEALILAIVIAYAVKKAAESASGHWQASKGADRKASRGKPARKRAASAARHDTAYWAEQVRGGFPQVRHGLYMGWNAGRIAQLDGRAERAAAKADHAQARARVTETVREQRRRQAEALDRIRAAAREPEPEPAGPDDDDDWEYDPDADDTSDLPEDGSIPGPPCELCGNPLDPDYAGVLHDACRERFTRPRGSSAPPAPYDTKGTAMSSGDTTYTQQMHELEEIRRDAEAEVNSVQRKRMMNRLDVLLSLGLDKGTLSEAAAIDDALREQEKAARQTLDATDAAIAGLQKRHGGIKEAVDDSPADRIADDEFYRD